jgi:excisionase family DNA binding protein
MKSKLSAGNLQRRPEGTVTAKVGSLKYAATKLACGVPKLYDLIDAGKLRSYHIGRAHRVSEQAIADCIALLERESAQHLRRAGVPINSASARATPRWSSVSR